MAHEHDLPLAEYHRAGVEITNGNPNVYKSLYSRRDDATLANPFGPPARGWSEVSSTLDRAAENYRDGEAVGFENVSTIVGEELAYTGRDRELSGPSWGSGGSCACVSPSHHGVPPGSRRMEGVA